MDQFFVKDFTGGNFGWLGTAHLIALLSTAFRYNVPSFVSSLATV